MKETQTFDIWHCEADPDLAAVTRFCAMFLKRTDLGLWAAFVLSTFEDEFTVEVD